jgi:hypothetical protein
MPWGSVRIGCEVYESDVVVHAGGRVAKRKKKRSKHLKDEYGHTPLSEAELGFLEEERPDVVYVGTGYEGALPITPGAREILEGYEAVIAPTPEIEERMGQERRRFVAIVHVTC